MNPVWVGDSETFKPPARVSGDIVFPLVEETVMSVAFDPAYRGMRRISQKCAIRCTSRAAQRWALMGTSLNPRWFPYPWAPDWVVKAPASCLNNGVAFTRMTEHVENLQRKSRLASVGVIEKKIGGEPVEVDGVRVGGVIRLFPVVSQQWDSDNSRILQYQKISTPSDLLQVVETCLDAVDLDDGCFCIELRRTPEWKVIEVHARLGEDTRLGSVWGFDPITRVEDYLKEGVV